jgi:CheY-like chemotaxis protein
MLRIRLIHWRADEGAPRIAALRAAGYEVEFENLTGPDLLRKIRTHPPDAVVIDLTRLPSHGREYATALRGSRATRYIPLVFVDGDPSKVDSIREKLPDAIYATSADLAEKIQAAVAQPPTHPVVPPAMMDRYRSRPVVQKLGIAAGHRVFVVDPPPRYERLLDPLPEGVEFTEETARGCAVSLWFVTDPNRYASSLRRMREVAARSKLWIVWPKGENGRRLGLAQPLIRQTAMDAGLVDYKICSVNDYWTAMLFAVKNAGARTVR